ncbi:MAG: hypothetical protein HY905_17615 [Deltaproteobacteria bacterium]|nr:hypothetical protein [Deltaproteobacteria bacterium]
MCKHKALLGFAVLHASLAACGGGASDCPDACPAGQTCFQGICVPELDVTDADVLGDGDDVAPCRSDRDCPGRRCEPASGRCVDCLVDDDCLRTGERCSAATHTCARDGDADGGDDGTSDGAPVCGNSVVEPHEECDDGAANSDSTPDACRTDCREAHCGDGVADTGEGCDDGNANDDDGCRNDCRPPTCGDGIVQAGEDCDDGNDADTDACLSTCVSATCGDGFVWEGVEPCDGSSSVPCTTACGNSGTIECTSCEIGSACTPPVEACNGVDDDCDTEADEGFPCLPDELVDCVTTCGSAGRGYCTALCETPWPETCQPNPEACNSVDDDCDGSTDEGFLCRPGELVACRNVCGAPAEGLCTDECVPPIGAACGTITETCNGLDDDCDTVPDNGFSCAAGAIAPCTTACGTAGSGRCTAACEPPISAACTPPVESCNGADDDCDGAIDEAFPCRRGALSSCTTSCGSIGTGICTAACVPASAADCTALPEVCNGLDDDCDGSRDEGFECSMFAPPSPCTTSCGSTGLRACMPPMCTWSASCAPPAESCNSVDDDCDGSTDESFACASGTPVGCTTTCGSTGAGVCTATCTLPTGAACVGPSEICNGRDDDCDYSTDEGFPCRAGATLSCTSACGTTGTTTCTATCTPPPPGVCTPPSERCNMIDDDCDTVPDDGFECRAGSTRACAVGSCSGTQACSSSSCAWGTCNSATANDTCYSSPIPDLDPSNGTHTVTADTCAAGADISSVCGTTTASGPDVVYRLVLMSRKTVVLDTLGTSFDAMLFLRSGSSCGIASAVDCDDNSASGTPGQARVSATLAAGTYWVVVDSPSSTARGPLTLNVTISDPVPPANDACAGATTLTLTSALQSVSGDTGAGTDDNVACSGSGSAPDVWYTFTLAVPTAVYLSTLDGRSWGTALHVRSGGCTGPLTAYGCATSACLGNRSMFAGILPAGTYYVAVDGLYTSYYGPFTLYYQGSSCVGALDATPATPATVDPIRSGGTFLGSTVGAGNDSTGSCAAGPTQTAPDAYYMLALCPGRTVSVSTCDSATVFDTVLYARYGTCVLPPGDTDSQCNNDPGGSTTCPLSPPGAYASGLFFGSGGQGLYYLWVDGYVRAGGPLPSEGTFGLLVSGL